jgi:hypothetical protein
MASLYEQLMAAKGSPQADKAPNTTQMRSAPMNLRSAMRKYAMGGDVQAMTPQPQVPPPPQISASEINNFVQANLGNPQAIADAARTYGVSADMLASATGYSGQQINDYFGNAGLSPFAPQVQVDPIPPQKPYYDEPIYDPTPPQRPIYEPRTQVDQPRYVEPTPPQQPIYEPRVSDYTMPVVPERPEFLEPPGFNFNPGYGRSPVGSYGDTPEDFGYPQPTAPFKGGSPRLGGGNNDVVMAIMDALKSGRGTRDEQQKLMDFLESIKGR